MTLVEIRHGRCRELLYEVSEPPAGWAGTLSVPSCTRCSTGRPGLRRFARWGRARLHRGEASPFTVTLGWQLRWAALRPAVERALASGRVQIETLG